MVFLGLSDSYLLCCNEVTGGSGMNGNEKVLFLGVFVISLASTYESSLGSQDILYLRLKKTYEVDSRENGHLSRYSNRWARLELSERGGVGFFLNPR